MGVYFLRKNSDSNRITPFYLYAGLLYDSVAIEGGIKTAWVAAMPEIAKSTASLRTLFPAGGYALYGFSKMFAPLGISAAFYATAKEKQEKRSIRINDSGYFNSNVCRDYRTN